MRRYVYATASSFPCNTCRWKDLFADAHSDIDMRTDLAVAVRTFVRSARRRHIIARDFNAHDRASARNGGRMCRIRRYMRAVIKAFDCKKRISQALYRLGRLNACGATLRRARSCSLLCGRIFTFDVGKRLFCGITSGDRATAVARAADRSCA